MRDWLNRYGLILGISLLVLALFSLWFFNRGAPTPQPAQARAFYVDEETKAESVHPKTDVPPLIGSSGKPTVVLAVKCSCDGGKTSKVWYYLKYTPEGKAALEKMFATNSTMADINIQLNTLVRSPETGSQWIGLATPEGQTLTTTVPCEGGRGDVVAP